MIFKRKQFKNKLNNPKPDLFQNNTDSLSFKRKQSKNKLNNVKKQISRITQLLLFFEFKT